MKESWSINYDLFVRWATMIPKAVVCWLVIVIWPFSYSSASVIRIEQRDPRCDPHSCQSIELPYLRSDDAAQMEVTIGTRSKTSAVELHCESCKERCTIPGLNDPHFPFIYGATFNISYTMRNGSEAVSWFTILPPGRAKLRPTMINSTETWFSYDERGKNWPHYQLEVAPKRYEEIVHSPSTSKIYLRNLVPNRSYQLKVRVRNANKSIWSVWSIANFTTTTAPQSILGYDVENRTLYVAKNKWNLVLDKELSYDHVREEDTENFSANALASLSPGIFVIRNESTVIVTWDFEEETWGENTLRLIWTFEKQHPTSGIYLADHNDFFLQINSSTSRYHIIKLPNPFNGSFRVGYTATLGASKKASAINWLDVEEYVGVLAVWRIFNVSVQDGDSISWRTNDAEEWLRRENWTVEISSPDHYNVSIDPSYNQGEYRANLSSLSFCAGVEARISWNSIIKSRPFNFTTPPPPFRVTSVRWRCTDCSVTLEWTVPDCPYPGVFYQIYLHGQGGRNISGQASQYTFVNLKRNTIYDITLAACARGQECTESSVRVRTDIYDLNNIQFSSVTSFGSNELSAECMTDQSVDHFVYVVRNVSGRELRNVTRKECVFRELCSFAGSISVFLAAEVVLRNGSIIRSEERLIAENFQCNSNSRIGMIVVCIISIIILSISAIVASIYNKRLRRSKDFNVILPIELNSIQMGEESDTPF